MVVNPVVDVVVVRVAINSLTSVQVKLIYDMVGVGVKPVLKVVRKNVLVVVVYVGYRAVEVTICVDAT